VWPYYAAHIRPEITSNNFAFYITFIALLHAIDQYFFHTREYAADKLSDKSAARRAS
jgi:hypothetical protein